MLSGTFVVLLGNPEGFCIFICALTFVFVFLIFSRIFSREVAKYYLPVKSDREICGTIPVLQ